MDYYQEHFKKSDEDRVEDAEDLLKADDNEIPPIVKTKITKIDSLEDVQLDFSMVKKAKKGRRSSRRSSQLKIRHGS